MSARASSLVAGISLLLMGILGVFANFIVLQGLVTADDAVQTASDIANSTELFRFGVLSFLLVATLDVIVAAALFELFAPVHRSLSMLTAWLRIVYAGVFAVAISQLAGVPRVLDSPAQAMGKIDAFNDTWSAGFLLFGIHLLAIGYLAWRSGWMPRIISILLVLAGGGYIVDSAGEILIADYAISVSVFTFIGEIVLIVWLLAKGRQIDVPAST